MPSALAFRWSADILDELLVHLGLLLQFQHLQQCKAAPSRVSSELTHAVVADSADELRSDAGKPCCCEAAPPGMKAAMLSCFAWIARQALCLTVTRSCPLTVAPLSRPASFAEAPMQPPLNTRGYHAQATILHAGMRRRPSSQAGLLATAPAALVASTATQVAAGPHGWRTGRQGRHSGPVETSDSSGTSRQTEGGESTVRVHTLQGSS